MGVVVARMAEAKKDVGEKRKAEEDTVASGKSQRTGNEVYLLEATIEDASCSLKCAKAATFDELACAILHSFGYESDTCVWSVHFDNQPFSDDAVYVGMAGKDPEAGSVEVGEKLKGRDADGIPDGPRVVVTEKKGTPPAVEDEAEDDYEVPEESDEEEDEEGFDDEGSDDGE